MLCCSCPPCAALLVLLTRAIRLLASRDMRITWSLHKLTDAKHRQASLQCTIHGGCLYWQGILTA